MSMTIPPTITAAVFDTLPISAVMISRNRAVIFARTLESMVQQGSLPTQMILVDASDGPETEARFRSWAAKHPEVNCVYAKAVVRGAAPQRNQGTALATQEIIWFVDDDVLFEAECLDRLFQALTASAAIGGVNAMITNQRYFPPGRATRALLRVLSGKSEKSYAGMCIGPAMNLLPEDSPGLPEVVPVEWLNTTCTLYRRSALPSPPFPAHFTGYSLMEDLALSLEVGKRWQLKNARTARILHDSQPGDHKSNLRALTAMELVNRHYVMSQVLGRNTRADYLKLMVQQLFGLATSSCSKSGILRLPLVLLGKWDALRRLLRKGESQAR